MDPSRMEQLKLFTVFQQITKLAILEKNKFAFFSLEQGQTKEESSKSSE